MSIRILIVDDTKFLRMMLTDILTRFGYEVVGQAENGLIALEKFKELKPDIIIMDITMPEMDGIEALKEILVIDPKAIILICSAMSQRGLISKALKAGAINYVMKPFEPELVNDIILQALPMVEQRRLDEQKELEAQKELEVQKEQQEQYVKEQNKEEVITIEQPLIAEAPVVEQSVISVGLVDEGRPVVEEALVVAEPVIEEVLVVADEIVVEEDIDADPMIEQEAGDIEKVELEQEQTDQTSEEEEFGSLIRDFGEAKDHFDLSNEMAFEENVEIEEKNNGKVNDQNQVLIEVAAILAEVEKAVDMKVRNKVEEGEQLKESEQVDESERLEELAESEGETGTEAIIDVAQEADEMNPTIDEKLEEVSPSSYHNDLLENFISSISKESVLAQLAAAQQAEKTNVSNSVVQAEGPEQNLELKRKKMKNFASSIMCKWSEEVEDKEVNYFLGYNEYEKSIRIDMISEDDKRESIQLSLDGFSFICEWLQQKGVKIDL